MRMRASQRNATNAMLPILLMRSLPVVLAIPDLAPDASEDCHVATVSLFQIQQSLLQHDDPHNDASDVQVHETITSQRERWREREEETIAKASTVAPISPVGYCKTLKTGSSTLMWILESLALTRGLKVMWPSSNEFLGYPYPFPGDLLIAQYGLPSHQFDMIRNHAVFNQEAFSGYLKPDPVFCTILREPTSQAISAFNYFPHDVKDWESHIAHLEHSNDHHGFEWGLYPNNQAYSLGWYEYVGGSTKYDNNSTLIKEWLGSLDDAFGPSGSMILLEYFDEGLVLLGERLHVEPSELAYLLSNENHRKKKSDANRVGGCSAEKGFLSF